MFGSAVLDVAVGFSFVYFSFSLVCSSVREFISRLLHEREKDLVRGIYRMLGQTPPANVALTPGPQDAPSPARDLASGQAWAAAHADKIKQGLVQAVLGHSLVRGLASADNKMPTYIPSQSFAHALLDTLAPSGNGPRSVNDVRAVVQALPERLRQALLPLVNAAGTDIVALQQAIERRFDDAMDRVSGWYARRTQLWLVLIALLVAVVGNVDSIEIGSTLWRDPTVRAYVVARAAVVAHENAQTAADAYGQSKEALATLQIPLGWEHLPRCEDLRLSKLVGYLLTMFALLLGPRSGFKCFQSSQTSAALAQNLREETRVPG